MLNLWTKRRGIDVDPHAHSGNLEGQARLPACAEGGGHNNQMDTCNNEATCTYYASSGNHELDFMQRCEATDM